MLKRRWGSVPSQRDRLARHIVSGVTGRPPVNSLKKLLLKGIATSSTQPLSPPEEPFKVPSRCTAHAQAHPLQIVIEEAARGDR